MAESLPPLEVLEARARFIAMPSGLLIDGSFREATSGRTFTTLNPATGENLTDVAEAGTADVDDAVAAARRAFDEGPWPQLSGRERGRILFRVAQLLREHADELAILECLDNGKPIAEARWAPLTAAQVFEYYAGWADKYHGEVVPLGSPHLNYVLHEPVGVVGAIIPWNFPLSQATFKAVPAVAMGNTVVLKPAEQTPLTALRLGELCLEAGMPAGVWNIVPGIGEVAGAHLASHPGVDAISFTGSTAVGREVMARASATLKRVSLELGGKTPNIVFPDADLEAAVRGALTGIFYNQGQICNAGSRLFLHERIHDDFVERLVTHARDLKVGNPLDPLTCMGAIVSEEQLAKDLRYIESGISAGATLKHGGSRITDLPGYFLEPTIFTGVDNSMEIAQEEVFGPVLSVINFHDLDEVVRLANATMYGLADGVWTRDIGVAQTMARRLHCGTVWINIFGPFDIASPWTGFKQSGVGTEWGRNMLDFVTQPKSVWIAR